MERAEHKIRGIVFDIDRFAIHDGPGIRTTVFLKGCPLRCRWCHSPDSMRMAAQLIFREARCIACGRCVQACPQHAHELALDADGRRPRRTIHWERCVSCGSCAAACLGGALAIWGRGITAGEVVETVLRQRVAYRWSGGGVTLSGGEPTLQLRFSRAILKACREAGVHTALETCGFAPWSSYESLLPHVDLFLYDIKQMNAERHRQYTGVSNRRILANLSRLVAAGATVVARVPLIPGHTDSEDTITAIAGFVRSAGGKVVSLLPYNGATEARYAWIGRTYPLGDLAPQTPDALARLAAIVTAHGLEARIGF